MRRQQTRNQTLPDHGNRRRQQWVELELSPFISMDKAARLTLSFPIRCPNRQLFYRSKFDFDSD